METKDVKSKSDLLKDIDRQMKWIRILAAIAGCLRLRKRIKVITGPDMKTCYIPQVKLNIFSSWKYLNAVNEVEKPDGRVDLSEAIVKIARSEYTGFDREDEATQCLHRFEILLAQQKFFESAKPKYIYL